MLSDTRLPTRLQSLVIDEKILLMRWAPLCGSILWQLKLVAVVLFVLVVRALVLVGVVFGDP